MGSINLVNTILAVALEAWAAYVKARDEWRRLNPEQMPAGGWPSDADEIAALAGDAAALQSKAAALRAKYSD